MTAGALGSLGALSTPWWSGAAKGSIVFAGEPGSVLARVGEHLGLTLAAVLLAALVALPVGALVGHRGRGMQLALALGGLGRAVPTLALLVLLAAVPWIGVGPWAAVLAVAAFTVSPLLTAAATGVRGVDAAVVDAARGMGLSEWGILRRVELPLAVPTLAAGMRTAATQATATMSLAAMVGAGGVGRFVVDGFARQDDRQILLGAVLSAALTLAVDGLLAAVLVRPQRRGRAGTATQGGSVAEIVTLPRRRPRRAAVVAASLALAGSVLVTAGAYRFIGASGDAGVVRVAAFNFGESTVMAHLYAGAIRAAGGRAEVVSMSTREVIVPALESGEVSLVPEYLGTFTEFLNGRANGPDATAVASGDLDRTLAGARRLAGASGLVVGEPSAAADQNAFAVSPAFARLHPDVRSVSDLARVSRNAPVVLGGPPECPARPFCQIGLERVYGVRIASFRALDAGGPVTKQALTQGRIDVGLVFTSDAGVAAADLVVLADDKQIQTVDNLTPVFSPGAAQPAVVAAVARVSQALSTADLTRLNARVDIDREDPAAVAADYLREAGIVPAQR